MTSITKALPNEFTVPNEVYVPKEVLGNILKFLPDKDLPKMEAVSKAFKEAMDPKCDPALTVRLMSGKQEGFDKCFNMPEYIVTPFLTPSEGKIHLLKEEYFLQKASFVEKFKYLAGYTDLEIMKSYYKKSPELFQRLNISHPGRWDILGRVKIWKDQTLQRSKTIEQLPFYSRIPVKILSEWYLNPRITAYSYRIWNIVQRDTLCNAPTTKELFWSSVKAQDVMRDGIMVQNLDLLEFNSLKGRAICLMNAAFYASTLVVSVPLAALTLVVKTVAFVILMGIGLLIDAYHLLRYGTCRFFDGRKFEDFSNSMIDTLTPYNAIAVIRSLAGAIIHPNILLMPYYNTGNLWKSVSLPNYLLGV